MEITLTDENFKISFSKIDLSEVEKTDTKEIKITGVHKITEQNPKSNITCLILTLDKNEVKYLQQVLKSLS